MDNSLFEDCSERVKSAQRAFSQINDLLNKRNSHVARKYNKCLFLWLKGQIGKMNFDREAKKLANEINVSYFFALHRSLTYGLKRYCGPDLFCWRGASTLNSPDPTIPLDLPPDAVLHARFLVGSWSLDLVAVNSDVVRLLSEALHQFLKNVVQAIRLVTLHNKATKDDLYLAILVKPFICAHFRPMAARL